MLSRLYNRNWTSGLTDIKDRKQIDGFEMVGPWESWLNLLKGGIERIDAKSLIFFDTPHD